MPNRFRTKIYSITKKNIFDNFQINNYQYILFPKDNAVTSSIINGNQYHPYIFDFLLLNNINVNGKEIVEIGANNGNFTIDFANYVGNEGKVHAFEPQRIIHYQLCGNVFLNGFNNVYCHNIAVSNKTGVTKIEKPDYFSTREVNFGNVRVDDRLSEGCEYVECRRLDSYDFDNVILIKIDTQGHEYYVLQGALETISKHRPYIIFEIEQEFLDMYGIPKTSFDNLFNELQYTYYQFDKGRPYHTSTGYCIDYVAIPNELNPNTFIIPYEAEVL